MRRRTAVAAGAVAVAAVAGGAAFAGGAFGDGGETGGTDPAAALPPATAAVTRADLVERAEQAGTLGFGETTDVAGRLSGTVTWLPAEGQVLRRGQALYRVDTFPVVLLQGTLPAYRRLAAGVDDGEDVRQLESNLRALGYTGFTVDDDYTSATAAAVERWQDDLGVPETGAVEPGEVVFAAGPVRVAERPVPLGGDAQPGAAVLRVTGTARTVDVDLPVADGRLARAGAAVTVELPGGRTVPGRVAEVGRVAELPDEEGADVGRDATIAVTVTLTEDAGALDGAPVSVGFTSQERKGVLTVPVAALLALSEGGYGVEVVSGGSTNIVAVETGLFADGRVEVSGTGIAEGTRVGVPRS